MFTYERKQQTENAEVPKFRIKIILQSDFSLYEAIANRQDPDGCE